jgi:ABC-type uncharacterized transport system involved in gliding motility auxiliary subunit
MSSITQRKIGYTTLVLLAVAFIAAVIASNSLLGGLRIDLTENDLYTLSPGTKSLLKNVEQPINLYFFFSDHAAGDIQVLRNYATRVREMLEEFAAESGGSITLHVIDPQPFSEEEDRAAQYGLRNVNAGSDTDTLYFGLAATNAVGDQAVIDVFDPSKEGALEYDLARLIYSLAHPDKNVVGLISGVPMGGGFDPQTRQPRKPWVILQQAKQLFDVRMLPTSVDHIDKDISLLWIVHPTDLDRKTLYAIDQFVLGGGRALVFVDPLAEVALASAGPTPNPAATSSTLEPLFSAWGLKFDTTQVVADNRYALRINMGGGRQPLRHIGLLGLDQAAMDGEDVVTAGLSNVNIGTAGFLTKADDAKITLSPLLTSSAESAAMPADRFQFLQDPEQLLDQFTPTSDRYVLAARIQGPLKSAFPDGPPQEEDSAGGDSGADTSANTGDPSTHIDSTENANVIVVADVDVLSDRLWVQAQRSLFGQQLMTAFANNGDFVSNALANLSGSKDLINLKSRATFDRPFTTVEALRREADAEFRQTEKQLEAQLSETQQRLGQLQASREDTGSLLMTPEQQQEVQRFQDEELGIRKQLRSVRRDLDRNIERLGTTLKIVNILVVPFVLVVFALVMVLINRKHKQRYSS